MKSVWKKLSEAVHSLLTVSPPEAINTFSAWIANTKDNQTVHQKEGNCSPVGIEIVNDLVKTNLLASVGIEGLKIEGSGEFYYLHRYRGHKYIFIGHKRNNVLSSSIQQYPHLISCSQKLYNTPFFDGQNVFFNYNYNNKTYRFQWWGVPQKNEEQVETDVYIYDASAPDGYPRRDPFDPSLINDILKYYCAEIPADTSPEQFLEVLNKLINDYESTCLKHAVPQEATQTS